jgi:uncharacterized protein YodC (DUF2158 family)
MNVELIVAGVSNPGPKNTNVAFTVDGNGVRREAWIPNETVKMYSITAGTKLIVEQVAKIGDVETHWENAEGDMIEHKFPKQRVRLGGSLEIIAAEYEEMKPLAIVSA